MAYSVASVRKCDLVKKSGGLSHADACNTQTQVWIAQRVTELLGVEDDVLIGYVYEHLEGHKARARLCSPAST